LPKQRGNNVNLNGTKQLFVLGLAVAGSAGAAALITAAVTDPKATQTQLSSEPKQVPAGATSVAPAVPAPAAAPRRAPKAQAAAPTSITLDQARAFAERAANGRADKVEADTGPGGLFYDVSVVRADGVEADLVVDGRTGRVLSNVMEPQDSPDSQEAQDVQEPQSAPDTQDIQEPQDAQSPSSG
jgi:uncharacterized membrane protein YkoI